MTDTNSARDPREWSPRVVVIGGGVAGYAAARQASGRLPRARVHLYDRHGWHHYSACGMTFAVEGMYEMGDVVLHTPEEYSRMGIEVHEGVEATSVDLYARTVHMDDGTEVPYDVLVLATGRRPFVPPVQGIDLPGVLTLSNYGDGESLAEAIGDASRAIVVGGGAIGLETAVALRRRGLEVTVVEMLPFLLPQMVDADMSLLVRDYLEGLGVRVLTGMAVGRFVPGEDGRVAGGEVLGELVPADLVVVSTGVRPEASLAEASGLDLGRTGGYATDAHLRVLRGGEPVEGVYAVGDCAEVTHAVTGAKTLSPLASNAYYTARSVVEHLLDPSFEHPPVPAPALVVIGDLQVGTVGLTEDAAARAGLGPWSVSGVGKDRSVYFPGASDLSLRLVGDAEGRLVGAQAVGRRDVKERMNLLALAISEGIPPGRLAGVERAYSPPVQRLQDPMVPLIEEFAKRAAALQGQS